jgi:hypothetical protein
VFYQFGLFLFGRPVIIDVRLNNSGSTPLFLYQALSFNRALSFDIDQLFDQKIDTGFWLDLKDNPYKNLTDCNY